MKTTRAQAVGLATATADESWLPQTVYKLACGGWGIAEATGIARIATLRPMTRHEHPTLFVTMLPTRYFVRDESTRFGAPIDVGTGTLYPILSRFVDVSHETAYGARVSLSFAVRVF